MKTMNTFTSNKGMSLVELMVAITISLFLIIGIFQIYLNSQTNYKTQKQISRLQENGRFAMHKLTQSIRMGGNLGGTFDRFNVKAVTSPGFSAIAGECYTGTRRWAMPMIDTATVPPPLLYGTDDSIAGFTGCVSAANYGTGDVISVHYASPQSFQDTGTPANKIIAGDTDVVQAGTLFLRADINQGKVYETKTCRSSPIDCEIESNAQSTSFTAVNSPVKAELFYIRRCNDTSADCPVTPSANDIPTLTRVSLEPGGPLVRHTALIEGVVSMQIQYGIDSDNDPQHTIDRYENADDGDLGSFIGEPLKWNRVKTVRVWLLMRSPDKEVGYVDPNAPYTMGDQSVTVDDGYRHMLFTTTINLRNPGQTS